MCLPFLGQLGEKKEQSGTLHGVYPETLRKVGEKSQEGYIEIAEGRTLLIHQRMERVGGRMPSGARQKMGNGLPGSVQ